MSEGNRRAVEKFFEAVNASDWAGIEKLVDADYVWEMPQSGERVRGAPNNRAMNENVLKVTGTGDDYTSESKVTYPDGSVWHAVDVFHFRAGKIHHQTAYFAASLDAPEWRARWVERF
jgi:ketosteroid isomerase-like protein